MSNNQSASSRVGVIVAVLLCVASLGLAIVSTNSARQLRAHVEATDAEVTKLQASAKSAVQAVAEAERLRKKLLQQDADYSALRAELDKLKQKPETATETPETSEPAAPAREANRGRGDGRSWMDRMKEEDPERYKQMQEERHRRRQQIATQFQAQL